MQGLREGGSGGTSYPGPGPGGPGLRGPGRVEVVASSFGRNFFLPCPSSIPDFGKKIGPNVSEDLFFFCSSPNFGQKMGPNLSENLFSFICKCLTKFWGPGVDFRTPWKNFSLRPCGCVAEKICKPTESLSVALLCW